MNISTNFKDIIQRAFKYLAMFVIVYLACMYVPSKPAEQMEIVMIGVIVACAFAFMELYYPTIELNSEQ